MSGKEKRHAAPDADNTVDTRRVPIVFVPGFMATRLKLADKLGKKTWLWDPDESIEVMLEWTKASPKDKKTRLDPTRCSATILGTDSSGMNHGVIYRQAFYEFLATFRNKPDGGDEPSGKTTEGSDKPSGKKPEGSDKPSDDKPKDSLLKTAYCPLYIVGYDWRQSPKQTATEVNSLINRITNKRVPQVIVITHSMGGLVARWAFKQFEGLADKVRGVIHIAQPVNGAPLAFRQLFTGGVGAWGDGELSDVVGHKGSDMAPLASVLPGLIDLLPTPEYQLPGEQSWYTIRTVDARYETDYMYGQSEAFGKNDKPVPDPAKGYATDGGDAALYYEPAHHDASLKAPLLKLAAQSMKNHAELGHFMHKDTWSFVCTGEKTDIGLRRNDRPKEDGKIEYAGHTPLQLQDSESGKGGDGTVPTQSAAALFPDQLLDHDELKPDNALDETRRQYVVRSTRRNPVIHSTCMNDWRIREKLTLLVQELVKPVSKAAKTDQPAKTP